MPTAPDTYLSVPLDPAHPLFVLGHNGVGKSALMHALHMQLRNAAQGSPIIFVPGSRPGYFEHESLSLTPESKRALDVNAAIWDQSPDVRWRPMQGTIRNEKAAFNLQAADVQFRIDASNDIAVHGTQSGAIARLMARNGPLDRANRLLKQANLPVQLVFSSGEVKATRGGAPYSIARLSDGERASLLLIAETLSAAPGSFFVIDEPELHIHRSIVVPLLAALIKERPDCAYLISTHEINLPQEIETSRVLMVRGCEWVGAQVQAWDADLLPPSSEIPDELERDILGSRRKILFIEGVESSLDEPLYALLFPKVSIRPKESCRDVQRAVVGLRSVPNLHSTEPYGLIDNDSLAQEEIEKLQAQQIYALPIFSVESLYYCSEIRAALAASQASNLGLQATDLLDTAEEAALKALSIAKTQAHLAARVSERRLRDLLLSRLPNREELAANPAARISVEIASPHSEELARIAGLVTDRRLEDIVSRYPVRESGALDAIAKGLRFVSRADYEKASLVRLEADPTLAQQLRGKLSALAAKLD